MLERLTSAAALTPSPDLHLHLLHARALLAQEQDAEVCYEQALGQLAHRPWLRARLQLGYASWLRRRHRVADSRAPLRGALSTFEALGAHAWAAQARIEVRAAGERPPGPAPSIEDVLSPQEQQIVRYAAAGLTNREIGERLYLSPRTVGSHLYRVFPKLGITSRGQLSGRVGPLSTPGTVG